MRKAIFFYSHFPSHFRYHSTSSFLYSSLCPSSLSEGQDVKSHFATFATNPASVSHKLHCVAADSSLGVKVMPALRPLNKAPEEDAAPDNRNNHNQPENEVESDGSRSSSDDEYIFVSLSDLRPEFQCPICLGIIQNTTTIKECLHRFCKECIEKAMRFGNDECPVCRTHCASRQSLKDDPKYDALIAVIYPDIYKFEEDYLSDDMFEKLDIINRLS